MNITSSVPRKRKSKDRTSKEFPVTNEESLSAEVDIKSCASSLKRDLKAENKEQTKLERLRKHRGAKRGRKEIDRDTYFAESQAQLKEWEEMLRKQKDKNGKKLSAKEIS